MSSSAAARLDARKATPPKWQDPCAGDPGSLAGSDEHDADADAGGDAAHPLQPLRLQLDMTLDRAKDLLAAFFKKKFPGWVEDDLRDKNYTWLPAIPRVAEGTLDHVDGLQRDKALQTAFTDIQKFAVGLEQIVWDREDNGDDFADHFSNAESQLRLVLCELLTAMQRLGVEPPPSVSRDLMSDGVRLEPQRDFRDWLIFRDYVNALEYNHAVFKQLD